MMLPAPFARLVGLIDAAIFFSLWTTIGALSAAHPYGAIPAIVFVLVPTSVIVGWRGAFFARLLIDSKGSARRAAFEGALCAVFVFVANITFSGLSHAAGGHFDDASVGTAQFWLAVWWFSALALISAAAGAVHGVAFFWFNKWLIRSHAQKIYAKIG